MQLMDTLEVNSWKAILRRRFQAERVHFLAMREYWENALSGLIVRDSSNPERVGFPLKLIETLELRDRQSKNTLTKMGVAEIFVETAEGEHLTVMKRHHDQVANALLSYMERSLRHMKTDDLRESVSLSES
jgi:hypothetical protein